MSHPFVPPQSGSGADRQTDQSQAHQTLELRWFASGPLPVAAIEWFERSVPHIDREHRSDSYLLTGRPDLGVKRRNHGPLEVKERRGRGDSVSIGESLVAHIEEWHKRIRQGYPTAGGRWIDVDKTVLTYRHRGPDPSSAASCDIELASVQSGELEAWTLALEAFGAPSERAGILRSAGLFLSEARVPTALAGTLDVEGGYPAWLMQRAAA